MMARIRAASTPSRRPVTNPLVKAATSIQAHPVVQGHMTLIFKVACHAESSPASPTRQASPVSVARCDRRSVAAADLEPGQAPAPEHEPTDDHHHEHENADGRG